MMIGWQSSRCLEVMPNAWPDLAVCGPARLEPGREAGSNRCRVRLMAESAATAPGRIFISYRREDTAYPAGWLYDRLAERFGDDQVFKDVNSIELGDDFVEVITRAVGSCDVLLALIGDQWLTITDEQGKRRLDNPHDFVRVEIEAALTRNVRVIPILIDEATMPDVDELPASLAKLVRRQALEISPTQFEFDTNRLFKVLDRTVIDVRTAQEDSPPTTASVGTAPDPRTTQLPTAAEQREHADQSPPINRSPAVPATPGLSSPSNPGKPLNEQRRRLTTRACIVAGVGALVGRDRTADRHPRCQLGDDTSSDGRTVPAGRAGLRRSHFARVVRGGY